MIRLVIADDHPLVLSGLERLLGFEPDFELVESCTDGKSAIAAINRHNPDVAVIDLKMPLLSGIEILRKARETSPKTRVVILTGAIGDEDIVEAMRLGVNGVILKEMAPRLLVQCIRKVADGEQWLEKASVGRAMELMLQREKVVQGSRAILTAREIQVVEMVARGMRNKEIGEQLNIGEGTVKVYLSTIYGKLDVTGRVELTLYAQKNGLA